jgi:hypothetical protein
MLPDANPKCPPVPYYSNVLAIFDLASTMGRLFIQNDGMWMDITSLVPWTQKIYAALVNNECDWARTSFIPPMRISSIFATRASRAARGNAAPKSDMKLEWKKTMSTTTYNGIKTWLVFPSVKTKIGLEELGMGNDILVGRLVLHT